MSSFIESAACKGRHPRGFAAHQRRPRSDLVARLLRQRRVARFIVAPGGFGKSYLAYEYANVVFSFNHVFWISGRSPCFLRDLDAGAFPSGIACVDPAPSLVVFEDVPLLDRDRVELFSGLVDELLAGGNEVIVTCSPACDAFAELHKDRLVLDGRDLMLDEDEVREALVDGGRDAGLSSVLPAELIPCLRWGDEGPAKLMLGLKREELASEMLLAAFALLLLQRGRVGDAGAFFGSRLPDDLVRSLAERYPYLGIDMGEGTYEAVRVDVDALVLGFGASFGSMARLSAFGDGEALALRCADALMVRGLNVRAVDFALAFSTKRAVARWLALRGWDLLAAASPKSVVDAYLEIDRSISRRRPLYCALMAWALLMLDNRRGAEAFASRAAFSQAGEDFARAVGCILLLRLADGDVRARALALLAKLLKAHELGMTQDAQGEGPDASEAASAWPRAAALALAFEDSPARGVSLLVEMMGGEGDGALSGEGIEVGRNLLMMGCAWAFDAIRDGKMSVGLPDDMPWVGEAGLPVSYADAADFERILGFSCECVERAALEGRRVGWFEMRLSVALERAYEHDKVAVSRMPAFSAMATMRREQLILLSQRDEHRKVRGQLPPSMTGSLGFPGKAGGVPRAPEDADAPARSAPPILRVRLFGTFEVRLGEEMLDPQLFSRQKMRTLLAVLVLNRGLEFTRDRLAGMLWPGSSGVSARKSFYSLWSRLREALTVDGECPYLIRDQYGCRLNPRYVMSDVQEFEELCRMLMFGRSDDRGWEYVYAQVSIDFAEVLLPGEKSNELILALRSHYHTQLVDALVAASSRLVATGEIRGALWFAREALRRDRAREDAYMAQMEAQIAADQRAAALETFFQCRRFLAKELGIDPSVRVVSLYRSIIEAEETFG